MAGDVRDARLFDRDPVTGITEYFHYDPETDGFVIQTQQDLDGFIEVTKTLANNAPSTWKGEWHHIASIPAVVLMELAKDHIITAGGHILDMPRYTKWLNDRDNRAFRTRLGRV